MKSRDVIEIFLKKFSFETIIEDLGFTIQVKSQIVSISVNNCAGSN